MKAKPPTFDGEVKSGQEAEAWFLGWGSISKSKATQEIWREEYLYSIWMEEHLYGGITLEK